MAPYRWALLHKYDENNRSSCKYRLHSVVHQTNSIKVGIICIGTHGASYGEQQENGIVYADRYQQIHEELKQAPVIDYQLGSVRDDFDFGSILLFSTSAFTYTADKLYKRYQYAGLYNMRLFIAVNYSIIHINEYLYTEVETDTRKSGEKQFDYVDPKIGKYSSKWKLLAQNI